MRIHLTVYNRAWNIIASEKNVYYYYHHNHHHQPKASVLLVYHSVCIPTSRGFVLLVLSQLKEAVVLLESAELRSGMLLNSTQCTRQFPTTRIIQPEMSIEPCPRVIPLC